MLIYGSVHLIIYHYHQRHVNPLCQKCEHGFSNEFPYILSFINLPANAISFHSEATASIYHIHLMNGLDTETKQRPKTFLSTKSCIAVTRQTDPFQLAYKLVEIWPIKTRHCAGFNLMVTFWLVNQHCGR